jgi:hypothetical protein
MMKCHNDADKLSEELVPRRLRAFLSGKRGLANRVLQPPQAFVAALFDLRPDGLQLSVIGARE